MLKRLHPEKKPDPSEAEILKRIGRAIDNVETLRNRVRELTGIR